MQIDDFSTRLRKALQMNNMTQSELSNKTKLDKSLISNYLSGNYKAKQDKLTLLANALNVNEVWLMGYDVPSEKNIDIMVHDDINNRFFFQFKKNKEDFDELDLLFDKNKDILTEEDKEYIKFIIEKRKKEIDKELGKE